MPKSRSQSFTVIVGAGLMSILDADGWHRPLTVGELRKALAEHPEIPDDAEVRTGYYHCIPSISYYENVLYIDNSE